MRKRKAHPPELKDKAKELRALGYTLSAISKEIGVSGATLSRWLSPQSGARPRAYYEENREAILTKQRAYEAQHKERKRLYDQEYRVNNKELIREKKALYYQRKRKCILSTNSVWYRKNKARKAAHGAKRRAMLKNAAQPHSIIEKMMVDNYYTERNRLTAETGVLYHVDHIWPLSKGGPHLPWNLQVLTALENLRKTTRI